MLFKIVFFNGYFPFCYILQSYTQLRLIYKQFGSETFDILRSRRVEDWLCHYPAPRQLPPWSWTGRTPPQELPHRGPTPEGVQSSRAHADSLPRPARCPCESDRFRAPSSTGEQEIVAQYCEAEPRPPSTAPSAVRNTLRKAHELANEADRFWPSARNPRIREKGWWAVLGSNQ